MKIAVFSAKSYDRQSLERYNAPFGHDLKFFEPRLSPETVALARGFPGVCIFVNDSCNAAVITPCTTLPKLRWAISPNSSAPGGAPMRLGSRAPQKALA